MAEVSKLHQQTIVQHSLCVMCEQDLSYLKLPILKICRHGCQDLDWYGVCSYTLTAAHLRLDQHRDIQILQFVHV